MNQTDRNRLTTLLRGHVADIAADLRAQMLEAGPVRVRAQKLHADEQVGEDFDVWTDLLSRRAAVLWVLKSVYVRVLEDKGLLSPGRLFDPEAWQLFERLAPNLGETAFLRWVYRDLASQRGGLPELFGPQPAEVAVPADELSRRLIAFWRARDPDTGHHWSFANERFDGELMGDLYQELDPTVKDRFALCQTPDFVREFILDRTLTPAIEEFGADTVRLLDPACGSGHFLIDGLKRLVEATAAAHPDWERGKLVRHALDRVVGIDLNDYACALARARLIMTAADLADVSTLTEAAAFHPNVYWADGLEQVERGKDTRGHQLDLLDASKNEVPKASLSRPEVRAALRKVLAPRFHVVAANPPYITEADELRRAYHTEKVGRQRRYVSAHRQYHLSEPFTERAFQLSVKNGYVGLIVDDSFMKKAHGKKLVEDVLGVLDLTLVVDISQAYIPFHGTPTALLFARNRAPVGDEVRAVMGKRGETGTPDDPRLGKVWVSVEQGWCQSGFENDYVSVANIPRSELDAHPWSLRGGGATQLKARIEARCSDTLDSLDCDIGRTTVCGHDQVYIMSHRAAVRRGAADLFVPLTVGEMVRDWEVSSGDGVLYPYVEMGGNAVGEDHPAVSMHFWPYRSLLRARTVFGKSPEERGDAWFGHLEHYTDRLKTLDAICFPFVATHNHFVLCSDRRAYNRTAPVVKLPVSSSHDDYLWLLGVMNSSVMGFWLSQVCQAKGGESTGKKRQSEAWSRRLEHDAGKVRAAPLPAGNRTQISRLASRLVEVASERAEARPSLVISRNTVPTTLQRELDDAKELSEALRRRMVALQEELDWACYAAYGLVGGAEARVNHDPEPLESAHRPFAIALAQSFKNGDATRYWFDAMGVAPSTIVPDSYSDSARETVEQRLLLRAKNSGVRLIEVPEYKRKWEPLDWDSEVKASAQELFADAVEDALIARAKPATASHLVAALQADPRLLAIAAVVQERKDVDLADLIETVLVQESVPCHPHHLYTTDGLVVREAWKQVWEEQRRQDQSQGRSVTDTDWSAYEYSQGSRGKPTHFLRSEYWKLRGKLDVPKERFIAFTEVPGRDGDETLYGWAGWTPIQRIRVMLGIDEDLEDDSVSLADRTGLLDSAWRLLPDAEREDAAVASRLRAELRSIIGGDGFSAEQLADWKDRFPPPSTTRRRRR